VAYTTEPQRVVTTHADGSIQSWMCEVCGPIEEVLTIPRAPRDLTPRERQLYLTD
jgi:hypothetical protein